MQVLVLGMHRSGTSAVIRVLNMMGAYLGPPERVKGANPENPKGFWENDDVVELNNAVLAAQGCLWCRLSAFDASKLADEALSTLERRARDLVIKLDGSRPWAIKDPRVCLLLPFWRPLLEVPVCVIVNRNALEVAQSLRTRNHIPLHAGIAMWELHSLEALRGSLGLPRILIQYADVIRDPVGSVHWLLERLEALGVRGLECPGDEEVRAFIDPKLYRQKADEVAVTRFMTPSQHRLSDALADGSALDMTDVPSLSDAGLEALRGYDTTLRMQMRVRQLKDIVEEREREIRNVQQRLDEITEDRARLEAALREAGEEGTSGAGLAAMAVELQRLNARVSALERALAEANEGIREIKARLGEP